MLPDGQLVAFHPGGYYWAATGAAGAGNHAIMQTDGNFVVYNPENGIEWQAGTYNNPGSFVTLQDDGNIVVYGPNNFVKPLSGPYGGGGVTVDDLRAIRATPANITDVLGELNTRMAAAGITTPIRKAAFLATLALESGFRYDIAEPVTTTCQRYSGGCNYRGRGFMQLTHDYNYRTYGPLVGADLVGNPAFARSREYSAAIATAFWSRHNLNQHADNNDMLAITRIVNGGTNGLAQRCDYFKKAMIRFTGSYQRSNGCSN